MANLPKISIIIPVYNVESYISECLWSVSSQTYSGKIECVIVDDCCKDHSIAMVEQFITEYKGKIDFRLLHHNCNRGLSAARNTGMNNATGEYVYFLDSDDYISKDCIEVLSKRLQEYPYQMVIGDYKTFGDKEVPSLLFETQDRLLGNDLIYHEHAERQLCVIACNKLCDISFLRENNILFKEGQLHEDDLWTYKVMSVAKSIAIDKHITYYYRMRETSIMGSNSNLEKKTISLYTTVDYILHHQDKHDNNDFETIAQTYIGKYIGYALGSKVNFFRQYLEIRKNYKYYPIIRYLKGGLTLMDIKHKFHYVLSPRLGYLYLMLRRQKLNQK